MIVILLLSDYWASVVTYPLFEALSDIHGHRSAVTSVGAKAKMLGNLLGFGRY